METLAQAGIGAGSACGLRMHLNLSQRVTTMP